MKKIATLLVFFFVLINCNAQQNTYSEVFTDSFNNNLQSSSVVNAFDNGHMIAGQAGYGDALVMKIDSVGQYVWSKSIVGNGPFNKIISTDDSCFVLAGNGLIVKININGDTLWSKLINGLSIYSIQQTYDSGYVMTGCYNCYSKPGIEVIKVNSTGNLEWSKIFGGTFEQSGFSIKQTPDSGYVVGGFTEDSSSTFHLYATVIKLSSSGVLSWSKRYGIDTWIYDLVIVNDGIVSYLRSGGQNAVLMKTDFSGNIIWSNIYGIYSENPCTGCNQPHISKTFDRGFVFFGGSNYQPDFIRVDSVGNLVWVQGGNIIPSDVIETKDSGFLFLGNGPLLGESPSSNGEPELADIKTNSSGGELYCIVPASTTASVYSVSIVNFSFPSVSSGGGVTQIHPAINHLSLALRSGCISFVGDVSENNQDATISFYPNPLTSSSILQLSTQLKNAEVVIYDVLGKEMMRKKLSGDRMEIEKGSLESGVYFVRVISEDRQWVAKMVVE